MANDVSYEEIVQGLNNMAATIAEDCIPNGRLDKNYWRGECHGKVSVHIKGTRVGMVGYWQDQGPGRNSRGGNLISLIELAHGCNSHGEAVRLAKKKYLGISDKPLTEEEKRNWARARQKDKLRQAERERKARAEKSRKVDDVREIWKFCNPIEGTLAERYLLHRGVEMPDGVSWPKSLRFHPCLELGENRHPALVAGVQAADRKLTAIWRIYLNQDGTALEDETGRKMKMGLGPSSGGAVRLGPASEEIIIAEGIETAFGAGLLNSWNIPTFSVLSTSGMVGFEIPQGVKSIRIYADGDSPRFDKQTGEIMKPPGESAALKFQERANQLGIETKILIPPMGSDWLDVWNGTKDA